MSKEIVYQEHRITLDTEQFGNGWAVSVEVDGSCILDKDDVSALHATEAEALQAGELIGRQAVDDAKDRS